MPSLIPGYNYDIFISYRQKDNKYDGWVTEFVDNLKKELEATFKEDISIYFDENPNDGLLETHNIDKSLEDKLKCIIFIPIISQIYCDPKSYAWQYEFCAFNKLAKEDQFGRDIKLTSGNVASRILPVKIHDLDSEDNTFLENELGGVLRCIEFIYKSPGVNRPLRANEDHPQDNLTKTYYRDQINKVANAVKEIITSLKKSSSHHDELIKHETEAKSVPQKKLKGKIIAGSTIVLLLIILGILIIPNRIRPKEQIEKSIAVLPFRLLSNEQDKQYQADGMMEAITLHLSKIKDLRVLSRTSTEQYRNPTKTTTTIGRELGVNYLLEGSYQKFGDNIKLIVQLIKTGKEGHVWGNEYNIKESDVFALQSQVAQSIAKELDAAITPEEKHLIANTPTTNLTAYDFYQRGREELGKFPFHDLLISSTTYPIFFDYPTSKKSLDIARQMYKTALAYDSTFAPTYAELAAIYWSENYYRDAFSTNYLDSVLYLANKALSFNDKLPDAYYIRGKYYSEIGNIKQARRDFDKTVQLDPNYWMAYYTKGLLYLEEFADADYRVAIENFRKAASLYHGSALPYLLNRTGYALSITGFDTLAKDYLLKAAKLEQDSAEYYLSLGNYEKAYYKDSTNILVLWRLGSLYDYLGKLKESLKIYRKYLSRLKENGIIKVNDIHRIGIVYLKLGMKDSADYCFKKQIENCKSAIRMGRPYGISFAYWDLAMVYTYMGDKIQALENLNIFKQREGMCRWFADGLQSDFRKWRDDPVFQEIFKGIESKYQAEHERVRKWLEENDML
jgi:TolB-like protein